MADSLYPITVPKWGIEMQEGTITGWQVDVGASVSKGDELIDIETDKIVNTMEAPVDGVVCRQLVEEGETLKVGELLGVIATSGERREPAVGNSGRHRISKSRNTQRENRRGHHAGCCRDQAPR